VVHHFVVREWLLHLATLEHLLESEPGGPTWLWRIRIRILKYMLGRYGGEPTPQIERNLERPEESAPDQSYEPAPPLPLPTILRPAAADHPPKPVSTLTPILDDIQLVNERCKIANASWAFPEAAWTWWRDEIVGRHEGIPTSSGQAPARRKGLRDKGTKGRTNPPNS
jgi:hypothetical protein